MNGVRPQGPACVIILGMHRSGTSLLAGCLEAAGLNLGEVNNAAAHNRMGNKENASIRSLNNVLLEDSGAGWRRPPSGQIPWRPADEKRGEAIVGPYLRAARPWGFKDPRTVWTIEGWLRLLPDAYMIGVFRHPARVARSLAARSVARRPLGPEEALSLWCAYNSELLRLQRKYRFPLLHFGAVDAFGEEFAAPLTFFARCIGLHGPLDRFFDARLVHQTLPGPVPSARARELFARLVDASRQAPGREGRAGHP